MTHKIAVLLLGLCWLGTAQAGAIVNGDFSDGLTGWITADTDSGLIETTPSASVGVVAGVAGLSTQGWDSGVITVSLHQPVLFDPLAAWLWFDIGFARGQPDFGGTGFGFPDYFQVSWVDDLDPAFDLGLIAVDANGFFDPETLAPRTPGPLVAGLYRFRFDITALAGRSGGLYFDLLEQDDGFFSVAFVDEVCLDCRPVPLPSTALLLLAGLVSRRLVRERGDRRRRHPV